MTAHRTSGASHGNFEQGLEKTPLLGFVGKFHQDRAPRLRRRCDASGNDENPQSTAAEALLQVVSVTKRGPS